jgi:integrase
VYDALVPGFGVRVSDKRKRTFIMYRRLGKGGRPVRYTLGEYVPGAKEGEEGSLDRARARAREAFTALKSGRDPKEDERKQQREEARRQKNTVAAVGEDFIKHYVSALRSGDHMESVVRRELIARWGDRPINEIERRDAVELVEDLAHRGKPHAARLAFAHARTFFNWAIERSLYGLEASPCDRVRVGKLIGKSKLKPRERALDDDEIRLVWLAAAKAGRAENRGKARPRKEDAPTPALKPGYPFGDMTKLLLLTGLRLREVAEARWREFDLDGALWTIPKSRTKGDAEHLVPLSPAAVNLMRSLPREKNAVYVLSTTGGKKPISGFGKGKDGIDRIVENLRKEEAPGEQIEPMENWRFHDLRRTLRTRLAALRVPDVVIEAVLGHKKLGLRKVYDQHEYLDEKKDALQRWAARLQAIVERKPTEGNVVQSAADARP